MFRATRLGILFASNLFLLNLPGASPADTAVFAAFRQSIPGLTHFRRLDRTEVTANLDLVIAIGAPTLLRDQQTAWTWWTEDRSVGLFLQDKKHPALVYSLGSKSGFQDCAARVERVTSTDTVISCQGEKSERYSNQKWVYDVRAKRLAGQFSYRPFVLDRVHEAAGGPIFTGNDTARPVAVEYESKGERPFRILTETQAWQWMARKNDRAELPKNLPALPQTTFNRFGAARPRRVEDGYTREGAEIHDAIGPWQREGTRIWFGKTFYDGEGSTGVGGFGYFDLNERQFHVFEPPEIVDWSVSALVVDGDAVWMALVHNGEYGGSAGGLLRYDRHSGKSQHFEFPDIAVGFQPAGGKLLAATFFGIAVIDGGRIERYFVDRTSDSRLRVALAKR